MPENETYQKKANSEYDQLRYLWKLAIWLQKHKIERPFIHFPSIFHRTTSALLGKLMLKGKEKKILIGLGVLFPKMSMKRKLKIKSAYLSYMGRLMWDMVFLAPSLTWGDTYKKFIKHDNLHYLDEALAKGKGVLLPTLHTSQLFHALGGLFLYHKTNDPSKRYDLVTIGGEANAGMYSLITARYPNYHVYITDKFSNLKNKMLEHLKKNHSILLYYDFSSMRQLKTPFVHDDPNTFFKSTPQSLVSLHQESGATILPVITTPDGRIGKTILKFLDPTPITKVSKEVTKQLENGEITKKEYHARLSSAVNNEMHPYILKYPHLWEELMDFGGYVYKHKISFEKNSTAKEFLTKIKDRCANIQINSFNPKRDDERLNGRIKKQFKEALQALKNPEKIFLLKKSFIRYFNRTPEGEISKILTVAIAKLKIKNETASATKLMQLKEQI